MPEGVTVSWRGERYEVKRRDGPEDGPGPVREKVLAWLEANKSRPANDIGRQ